MANAREIRSQLELGTVVNLRDPDLYGDPEVDLVFEWLRDNAPAYRDSNGLVHLTRFADICAAEINARRYTSSQGAFPMIDMSADESMINLDDPEHSAHRRVVVRRFTPIGMKPHSQRIRDIVTECVDSFASRGSCDLVAELAAVLPAKVICELLGFDRDRWVDCERWARLTLESANRHWDDPEIGDFMGAFVEFVAAATELLAQRRVDPKDDLISLWAHTEINGEPMTDKQVLEEAILLLDGGAETTRSVIGFGAIALCERPEQRQHLINDPTIIERSGVEELIRWVTPINMMRRSATEDHRLHDVDVATGDQIILVYRSGNRDERSIDRPHDLDVMRTSNAHVSFGFGTHYCVGANLARFEVRAVFEELFRRIPDFRIAPGHAPTARATMMTRALPELRLEFTPEQ